MAPLTPSTATGAPLSDTLRPAIMISPLSSIKRALLIAIGTIAVGLGIIGIVLPGVPTTIFFIIALGCYVRSSDRLYRWLLTRPWAAKSIQSAQAFKANNALPTRIKLISQGAAWTSVVTTIFGTSNVVVQIAVVLCALACSIAMSVIKTMPDPRQPRAWRMTARDITTQLWFGALSGMIAGAAWGLGARTIMRFVANVAGKPPLLNIPATLSMIVATAVLGVWIGMAYAGLRNGLPRNQWLRGVAWGTFVCATLGVTLYLNPVLQADILRVGAQYKTLIIALFIPNFMVLGLLNSLIFGRLEKRGG
jgi:hypothetical protein